MERCLSQPLFGVSEGAGSQASGWVSPTPRFCPRGPAAARWAAGCRCGCVAACLFVFRGPAGAGVFGVVVITGMAQP